jgi:hypothetical protein
MYRKCVNSFLENRPLPCAIFIATLVELASTLSFQLSALSFELSTPIFYIPPAMALAMAIRPVEGGVRHDRPVIG